MPLKVKGPDGIIRSFPDDATDAEIAAVLEESAPKPSRLSSLGTGAKEGLGDLKEMAKSLLHPIDTAKAMGSQLVEGAKAVPDVARNLLNSETRSATVKGFTEGAVEGGTGLSVDAAKKDPWRAGGRFLTNTVLPAAVLKTAPKVPRLIRGARMAAPVVESAGDAAARLAKARPEGGYRPSGASTSHIPYRAPDVVPAAPKPVPGAKLVKTPPPSLEQQLADALKAGDKVTPPPVELPPAPFSLGEGAPPVQPRVSVAGTKTPPKKAAPAPEAPKPASPPVERAPDAPAASPEPPAGPSSPPKSPGIPTISKDGQKVVVRPKPGVAGGLRSLYGAEKAAKVLGVSPGDVRKAAPGPSKRPLAVDLAEDDLNYRRRIADERGFIDPKAALKVGAPVAGAAVGASMADDNPLAGGVLGALAGAAAANPGAAVKRFNELRGIGMLSGGALPKSILGNIGAHINAAGEMGSLKPLKELARLPENFKNAKAGWKAQTLPGGSMTSGAQVEGLGRLNVFGRLMGALDDSSTASLGRAGVTPKRAKQLQLMEDNPVGAGSPLNAAFQNPVGRFLVPFQRVPVNQFAQGAEALAGLAGKATDPMHNSRRFRAMTAAAGAGGVLAGSETQDPITLALTAALAGSRAMPFAVGAGLTAGPRVLERVGIGLPEGSVRDLYDPTRSIDKPALVNWLNYLKGAKD